MTELDIAEYDRCQAGGAPLDGPLVSVVTVCKNAARFLPRCIASVRAQTYKSIEYLIQDAASTDNTKTTVEAEGVQSGYESEPDRAALDGLIKAAVRASGEIIAVCWADDELLPNAVAWGVNTLIRSNSAIVYGDEVYCDDIRGGMSKIRGVDWNIGRFIRQEFWPPFAATFYRRESLTRLAGRLTCFDHDEYEFWMILALDGPISYQPGFVAKFHAHERSRWLQGSHAADMIPGRLRAVRERLDNNNVPADIRMLVPEAIVGAHLWGALHLDAARFASDAFCHLKDAFDGFNGDWRFQLATDRLRSHLVGAELESLNKLAARYRLS